MSSLLSKLIQIQVPCRLYKFRAFSIQVQVLRTAAQVFTENFGSLPASPPLGGNFRSHSLPTT
ncbi:hypothetical protein M5K25_009754 [Dendrobium thyrsiflorum]|uniref:Uncharacterized protein n=1 Tax=Dendrobium thyrsiflorum TaxID=117978 RepID=A0ABD0V6G6_DENTH